MSIARQQHAAIAKLTLLLSLVPLLLAPLPALGEPAAAAKAAGYPLTFRFDEDYSYLADPSLRTDAWDPIKYIPLDAAGRTYLSFGGEWRERYEHTKGYLFNPDPDDVLMHRLMFSADLHIGSSLRSFVQLAYLDQSGRDGGPNGTDVDRFDFQQAFVDLAGPLGNDDRATVRVGRQEMTYGSSRYVSVREGPNSRRSFDGVRAMYRSANFDVDGFLVEPVLIKRGAFDDEANSDISFWGAYSVSRLAPARNIDLYYFGIDYDRSTYVVGTAPETRHTLGARFWGKSGQLDYNIETVYQFGRFGNLDISAWGIAADAGWTLSSLPFKPRLGIKANIESGDKDRNDGTLGTLNPLFPNHAYFSEAAVGAPMNDVDFQPNITFYLAEGVTFTAGYDFFWRQSRQDTVYTAGLLPIAGIAGQGDRYVGSLVTTHLKWRVNRHVELNFDYTHFDPSDTLEAANMDPIDFAMASVAYKF